MRRKLVLAALVALWGTSWAVAADEGISPRQSYQRVVALFQDGHLFTAAEAVTLEDLRQKLEDGGDSDLASSLDLLRLGAAASADRLEQQAKAKSTLGEDWDKWQERNKTLKDKDFWNGLRDGGLLTFSLATTSTLLLAATSERNSALLQNGFFTDWKSRDAFATGLNWAIVGSGGTMLLSLFPLLWGEAHIGE